MSTLPSAGPGPLTVHVLLAGSDRPAAPGEAAARPPPGRTLVEVGGGAAKAAATVLPAAGAGRQQCGPVNNRCQRSTGSA